MYSMRICSFKRGAVLENGLKVLHETGRNRHGKRVFIFGCLCGRKFRAVGGDVAQGKIRSCGCYKKKLCKARFTKPSCDKDLAARHILWHHYRINCGEKRNLEFKLTKAEFVEFTKQPCFFCGTAPSARFYKTRARVKVVKGEKRVYSYALGCVYNGVDRLDNAKGYTVENCVPCCSTCNRAKGQMPEKDFVSWAFKLATRLRSKGYAKNVQFGIHECSLRNDSKSCQSVA